MLTCDEIFETLTSESGDSEAASVEEHLSQCPRCQDLADAMAVLKTGFSTPPPYPAPSYSIPAEDSLSEKAGDESVKTAREVAARLQQSIAARRTGTKQSQVRAFQYLAAFLTGVAASALVALTLQSEPSHAMPAETGEACIRTEAEQHSLAASDVVQACVACHLPQYSERSIPARL